MKSDPEVIAAGERLYAELVVLGVEVLLDDRDERPGVKFNDAELIGIPYRMTLGPRSLAEGNVELVTRADGATSEIALEDVVKHVRGLLDSVF